MIDTNNDINRSLYYNECIISLQGNTFKDQKLFFDIITCKS